MERESRDGCQENTVMTLRLTPSSLLSLSPSPSLSSSSPIASTQLYVTRNLYLQSRPVFHAPVLHSQLSLEIYM